MSTSFEYACEHLRPTDGYTSGHIEFDVAAALNKRAADGWRPIHFDRLTSGLLLVIYERQERVNNVFRAYQR